MQWREKASVDQVQILRDLRLNFKPGQDGGHIHDHAHKPINMMCCDWTIKPNQTKPSLSSPIHNALFINPFYFINILQSLRPYLALPFPGKKKKNLSGIPGSNEINVI